MNITIIIVANKEYGVTELAPGRFNYQNALMTMDPEF